ARTKSRSKRQQMSTLWFSTLRTLLFRADRGKLVRIAFRRVARFCIQKFLDRRSHREREPARARVEAVGRKRSGKDSRRWLVYPRKASGKFSRQNSVNWTPLGGQALTRLLGVNRPSLASMQSNIVTISSRRVCFLTASTVAAARSRQPSFSANEFQIAICASLGRRPFEKHHFAISSSVLPSCTRAT